MKINVATEQELKNLTSEAVCAMARIYDICDDEKSLPAHKVAMIKEEIVKFLDSTEKEGRANP